MATLAKQANSKSDTGMQKSQPATKEAAEDGTMSSGVWSDIAFNSSSVSSQHCVQAKLNISQSSDPEEVEMYRLNLLLEEYVVLFATMGIKAKPPRAGISSSAFVAFGLSYFWEESSYACRTYAGTSNGGYGCIGRE